MLVVHSIPTTDIVQQPDCDLGLPQSLRLLGDVDCLKGPRLALFCSIRCPGDVILKIYDLAQELRRSGITVISGFHTPMEQEALDVLLRGTQPIIVCPARSLETLRIKPAWRQLVADGRMLVLSPFEARHKRITAELAEARNRFVAALASVVLVAYAEPGGKTAPFCQEVLRWGKRLYTLDSPSNAHLVEMGATAIGVDEIGRLAVSRADLRNDEH